MHREIWGLIYQRACKSPLKFSVRRKGKMCVRPKNIHSFQIYQTPRTHGCTVFPLKSVDENTPHTQPPKRPHTTICGQCKSVTCILSIHVHSGNVWNDVSGRRWRQQTDGERRKKRNFSESEIHGNTAISVRNIILHWKATIKTKNSQI